MITVSHMISRSDEIDPGQCLVWRNYKGELRDGREMAGLDEKFRNRGV
jgi:hypothetical protein